MDILHSLLASDDDLISQLSNCSALLMDMVPHLNWVGFYLFKGGLLVLGPFQGKPACTRISLDRGVCGTAARDRKIIRVDDVHLFPGHIACDSASRSELVIPLLTSSGDLLGVLDLDSPNLARFSEQDQNGFKEIGRLLESLLHWNQLH
jgi:GAF domain-containing protein